VANEPDVVRIKREKRERPMKLAPAGMTRRRFMTFLGAGSAALVARSTGTPTGTRDTPTIGGTSEARAAQTSRLSFTPIEPSGDDEVVLPRGFKYDIVRKWGDRVTEDADYGYNNDFVAYFPIDALDGGQNSQDGILWVNHEYPDPKWVSEYEDSERETEKSPEQIAQEKAVVGGSVFRVRRQGDTWSFFEGDQYNRRIDATTPMDLTGPAAGADEVQGANEAIGTLANCGGGVTPWNTVLTCEENYQDYYGERTLQDEPGTSEDDAPDELKTDMTYRWYDDTENAQPPEHYGWIVEVDPLMANSVNDRWLGRRLPALVHAANFEFVRFRGHGFVETSEAKYMMTIVDRGADVLSATGVIGAETAAALKAEARRRAEAGVFFGHIAYVSLTARKPPT
jgi:uncharacterized protein